MTIRHSGWIGHRLKKQITKAAKLPDSQITRLNSVKLVSGLEKKLIKILLTMNEYRKTASFNSSVRFNPVFDSNPRFTIRPFFPKGYHAYILKNMYLIRLLIARSYKILRMAKRFPVHGQRRWSNASSARRCNQFIWLSIKRYEIDLYRFRTKRKFIWSKQWEMRQKAKMRKKTKKKKWTKFKKFGERRLAKKKKKKTPWD